VLAYALHNSTHSPSLRRAQDGYFQQPQREAGGALRHRWLAAMALVAVHALLIASLLLVHAAVKATSVPSPSHATGLAEELLEMPARIEGVLEAAVDDAVDDEPGLSAEARLALDRAAAAPAAGAGGGAGAGAAGGGEGLGAAAEAGEESGAAEAAAEAGAGAAASDAGATEQAGDDGEQGQTRRGRDVLQAAATTAAPCAKVSTLAGPVRGSAGGAAAAPAIASLSLADAEEGAGGAAGGASPSPQGGAAASAPQGGAAASAPPAASAGAVGGGRVMRLYAATAADPLAVCNDGSPGAFYHRPGAGAGADKCAPRRRLLRCSACTACAVL